MKTVEDFKTFFNEKLMPDLQVLEQKRKSLISKTIIIIIVAAIAGLFFVSMISNSRNISGAFAIPLIMIAAVGGFVYFYFYREFAYSFKSQVIEKLVKFIDENLQYRPHDKVPQSTFMLSKIFTTEPNRYSGDDLVFGKVGETAIKFSELDAEYESGSGKDRHVETVFKGLFFIADFNKDFTCTTVVLPDTAEKLFGWLGQKMQEMNVFRGQLVKLEDAEFEKNFVVYSDDQIQARYILSPSLMERILKFKTETGRKIHLSFVGSMVFVAIPFSRNLFEPKLFSSLTDFENIRLYYDDLALAISIVDDLNLNTRIWSKE